MTVDEMIRALEGAKEEGLSGDTEVIVGHQPHYPFGYSIRAEPCVDHTWRGDAFGVGQSDEAQTVLVFTEGRQLAYGNRAWWSEERIDPEDDEEEGTT